ncbi:MAG: DUF1573 domain-containing protein [Cyclobacteriaceae bacterium]|nr:DUF1573 domain-containing protein [Cyclobacteriaceae bacterium]
MRHLLLTLGLLFSFLTYSQQAELIQFEETIHDFGTVKEEDGAIVYEFKFINNSIDSIKILHVKASCGCTTPGWSREAIAPGASGYIKAQYNTRNRPGVFNKSLTVTTNISNNTVKRLYIKGNVVPRPKTIEEELPALLGAIRLKSGSLNMGRVYTSEQKTVKSYEVYNASDSVISFGEKVEKPTYLEVSFEPARLAPKAKGKITITYDGKTRNDFGFVSDNIVFYTDESDEFKRKSLTVYATLQEYFAPLSKEEYANAPKLVLEEVMYDFGKIKQGEKVSHEYVLKNAGKTDLNIRAAKSTCTCATAKLKNDTIKPGESVTLEVTFDSDQRRGNQQKSITIFSNDPRNSMQRVTIKGLVGIN